MSRKSFAAAVLLATLAGPTAAGVPVAFSRAEATRFGEAVYVLGDLPALGGGDPARALRMVWGEDAWTLTVDLPAGAAYRYVFLVRADDPARLGDPANARAVSEVLAGRVPGAPAERTVRVRYLSGWDRVALEHDGGAVDLRPIGPGRGPGERLWAGEVRTTEPELSFTLSDGQGGRDAPPGGGAYRTGRARLTLAGGRVHAGLRDAGGVLPPSAAGRVERIGGWYSQVLGRARDVLVYLPPGYGAGGRRYPVLYMHDGQNLFGRGGPFGSWRVEATLDRLIAAGRVEPLIVVGVGNTAARLDEYVPDADGGAASSYARFLIDELKPWVDRTYRTLPGPRHTGVAGSSLGGIASLYLGWERPDVFGRVASLSGSYWLEEWVDLAVVPGPRRDLRIWLDSGDAGRSADGVWGTLRVRDALLRLGWVLGGDLAHEVDHGAGHDEASWRARFPRAVAWLFPPE